MAGKDATSSQAQTYRPHTRAHHKRLPQHGRDERPAVLVDDGIIGVVPVVRVRFLAPVVGKVARRVSVGPDRPVKPVAGQPRAQSEAYLVNGNRYLHRGEPVQKRGQSRRQNDAVQPPQP